MISTQTGPSYRSFVEHSEGDSAEADSAYWKKHLDGIEPCFLPG